MSQTGRSLVANTLTAALVAAAAVLIIIAVSRAHFNRRATAGVVGLPEPGPARIDLALFDSLADSGPTIGPSDAPIRIVVFNAYGCGHCAAFHQVLRQLRGRFPDYVSVTLLHFLPIASRGALQLELGAECAAAQGQLPTFVDVAFTNPALDPLRDAETLLGHWTDLRAFRRCLRSEKFRGRVESNTRIGQSLGVEGTPTSFVDGIPLAGERTLVDMDRLIASELDREERPAKLR